MLKKKKKKNLRIGIKISTLEIKSKAFSMAGLHFSVKLAFNEVTQREDIAKTQSRDRQKEQSEDKT